jgi:hypothetical protein
MKIGFYLKELNLGALQTQYIFSQKNNQKILKINRLYFITKMLPIRKRSYNEI